MDGAPIPALQHHFAALLALVIAAKRIERRVPIDWRRGEEIVQPSAAAHDLFGGAAKPSGQGLIDEQKAAAAVDRIKPDRCIVEKVE